MFGLGKKPHRAPQRPAADDGPLGRAASQLAQRLLEVGFDGGTGFDTARDVAQKALAGSGGDKDQAISEIVSDHRRLAAAGGFVTGLGGFITLPVALPANVLGFYVIATRMVAAIAVVRGYDIDQPQLRTAVLVSLVGADAGDVLKKAGAVSSGRLTALATQRLPGPALMAVNKAVGFRLIQQVGRKAFTKLGKGIPVAGGVIGAGMDAYLSTKIAGIAKKEFPLVSS